MVVILLFLAVVVILLVVVLSWSNLMNLSDFLFLRSKSSTYECGFEVKDQSRQPFSLRFFLIIIVFLVFDMELCLLLKLPYLVSVVFFSTRYFVYFMLVVLFMGVVEEWRRGLLIWK